MFEIGDRVSITIATVLTEYIGQQGVVTGYEWPDCYWVKLDSGIEIMPFGRALKLLWRK